MITKERFLVLVILVILILFGIREGCNRRSENELVTKITEYETTSTKYKDKFGNDIYSNEALKIATQQQIKALFAANNDTIKAWMEKFKTIQAGVIIKEKTIIKEVQVPFETKIPCDFKPFKSNKIQKEYQFYSTIANTGLTIDSLIIPNKLHVLLGEKKSGFLGMRKEFTAEVKNSNSLIQVSDISSFRYKPEKKWFERPIVTFLTGIGIGVVGKSLIK